MFRRLILPAISQSNIVTKKSRIFKRRFDEFLFSLEKECMCRSYNWINIAFTIFFFQLEMECFCPTMYINDLTFITIKREFSFSIVAMLSLHCWQWHCFPDIALLTPTYSTKSDSTWASEHGPFWPRWQCSFQDGQTDRPTFDSASPIISLGIKAVKEKLLNLNRMNQFSRINERCSTCTKMTKSRPKSLQRQWIWLHWAELSSRFLLFSDS